MKRTVLLVDDDRSLLDGLRRALRREPYDVLVATGAREAFALLAGRVVDAVVVDEGMPGMSGTEFLVQLRAEHSETIRIMLTGRASLDLAMRAINLGHVYRFLTKPCNPIELGIVLRQALQQRELMRQSQRLLKTVRRQSALLDPDIAAGVMQVERDASGAIVVRDVATDLDALLDEVQAELHAIDQRLAAADPSRTPAEPAAGSPAARKRAP